MLLFESIILCACGKGNPLPWKNSNHYVVKLEGLAPYGDQPSSSCGGLVAFGHQIGALWAPWLVKLKFGALCAPPSSSFGGLMAFVHLIWDFFVCVFLGA